MEHEARTELAKVARSDPDFVEAWSILGWLSDRSDTVEQSKLAEEGLAMIRTGLKDQTIIDQTALCLHHGRRTQEAYDLCKDMAKVLTWNAPVHYGMATYASVTERWTPAAWHLLKCLKMGGDSHMFFDLDLEHLFRHVAEVGPDRETALALAHPLFATALERSAGQSNEIDGILIQKVPGLIREHLLKDPESTFFVLSPRAPAEIRHAHQVWREETGRRIEDFARRASDRSKEFVLNSQLEWARAAARRGDFFAARNHCVFALSKRPDWMEAFAASLNPLGMRYFFDDIRAPMKEDIRFCRLIQLLTPMKGSSLYWAKNVMEEFLPCAEGSTLWMLAAAALANLCQDDSENLRLQREVMHRWPQDPAAYANAANILSRQGRWDAASWVVSCAPPSFHHLRMAPAVLRRVSARNVNAAQVSEPWEIFYGQPDVGGIVQGPSFLREVFTRFPELEPPS